MDKNAGFLALDLGTTTLAAMLVDSEGRTLARATTANPQRSEGLDVISRLEAAHKGKGGRLQVLLADGIKNLILELVSSAEINPGDIQAAAAAGNSAITSLLHGSDIKPLLFPPHRLPSRDGTFISPSELELGLTVPLYLFPLVNAFVGGDLVAFLYFQKPESYPAIYLDIGTNGEVALFTGEKWLVTSVAAGPAFEAAGISRGMPAQNGAIEGACLDDDRLLLKIRGKSRPLGICGSGLAEIIATGLQGELIDPAGTIRQPHEVGSNLAHYVAEDSAGRYLSIYRDAGEKITLTQQDIRSFQLAKGAVRAGVECLLEKTGLRPVDVKKVYLTGAFGLSFRLDTLKTVAMLPPKMLDNVVFVADGVLGGVRQFLLSPTGKTELQNLVASLSPYPLSGTPAFEKAFMRALDF